MLTDQQLAEIKARHEQCLKKPGLDFSYNDYEAACAASLADVPALLEEIVRLKALLPVERPPKPLSKVSGYDCHFDGG